MSLFHIAQRDGIRAGTADVDKFIEYVIVYQQQHGRIGQIVLHGEKTLRGIVGLYEMHLVRIRQSLVYLPVGLERDSSVEEHFEIGPYVTDLFRAFGTHHLFDDC